MTETKTVCDRCGKEINRFPRLKIWKGRKKALGIRTTYGRGAYDYTDGKLDFCADCYHDFEKWLEEKKED